MALLTCVLLGPWAWGAIRDKHIEGRWVLQSGAHGVTAGLVISIEDRELTGRGPCNQFRADWSQDDGASDRLSTLMACEPSVMKEEDRYFDLLMSATSVEVEDGKLRLTGPLETLVFAKAE